MTDWITQVIERLGYVGVGLLAFLENLIPPIPSELVLLLAGFTAAKGELSYWGVVLSSSAGVLLER